MKNGRIAVPSLGQGGMDGQRAGHFGHCDVFTLIDVKDGEIDQVSTINNKEHVQGGCMVPVQLLASHNVNALIVGGIERGARREGLRLHGDFWERLLIVFFQTSGHESEIDLCCVQR